MSEHIAMIIPDAREIIKMTSDAKHRLRAFNPIGVS